MDMSYKNILSSLVENSAFRNYTDMLRKDLDKTDQRLRTSSGDVTLRLQGRAQLLAELINEIDRAEKGN